MVDKKEKTAARAVAAVDDDPPANVAIPPYTLYMEEMMDDFVDGVAEVICGEEEKIYTKAELAVAFEYVLGELTHGNPKKATCKKTQKMKSKKR